MKMYWQSVELGSCICLGLPQTLRRCSALLSVDTQSHREILYAFCDNRSRQHEPWLLGLCGLQKKLSVLICPPIGAPVLCTKLAEEVIWLCIA